MLHAGDWLFHWAQRTPDATALQEPDTGRRFTYGALHARVCRLANALVHKGVRKGHRVAVLAQNTSEQFELLFACMKIGAIHTPLNWRLSRFELADILQDAAPTVLFHDDEFAATATALPAPHHVQFGAAYEALLAAQPDRQPPTEGLGMEDPVIILYTSGTTGRPKGAMLPLRQLTFNSHSTDLAVGLSSQDSTLVFLPLFHTGGLNCLATPLLHRGGRVVVLRKFDPDRVLEVTASERITAHMGVPTTFEAMADSPRFAATDLSSVRFILVGGAASSQKLLQTYKDRGLELKQGFGMTEVGPNDFSLPPGKTFAKMGSIGVPNFYLQARVVDEQGKDVPQGESGELLMRGPMVCLGYFRNEKATAAAIVDGWFHTGDLVRQDEEGYFFVVDRKKDMFISGGENVYPAEVEAVMLQLAAVQEVCVIGVPDAKWGEVGKAVLAIRKGHTLTEDAVLAHCKDKLARYKVPKAVVFVDALPRNASGKVVKPAVKEQFGR